ncbi:hypothetical protein GCM10009609_16490 [Pseudonocardia aurantiaca]|uniref:Uncharacterized protein n=1 Tax=Pseudonocardia aurantiaca TaxID=75290 RepID=A0ABW4FKT6_9PSEU
MPTTGTASTTSPTAPTSTTDGTGGTGGTGAATQAAARTLEQNSLHVEVPGVGRIELPPPDQLVFLGGIATLVVLQIIEWPVAAVLAVGHVLAHNRHHALLRGFGEALDEA